MSTTNKIEQVKPSTKFSDFMAMNKNNPNVEKFSSQSIDILLGYAKRFGDEFGLQETFSLSKEVTLRELIEEERDFLGENDYSALAKDLIDIDPNIDAHYTLNPDDKSLIDEIFVKDDNGIAHKTYPEEFINDIEPRYLDNEFYTGMVYDILTCIVGESFFVLYTLNNDKILKAKIRPKGGENAPSLL